VPKRLLTKVITGSEQSASNRANKKKENKNGSQTISSGVQLTHSPLITHTSRSLRSESQTAMREWTTDTHSTLQSKQHSLERVSGRRCAARHECGAEYQHHTQPHDSCQPKRCSGSAHGSGSRSGSEHRVQRRTGRRGCGCCAALNFAHTHQNRRSSRSSARGRGGKKTRCHHLGWAQTSRDHGMVLKPIWRSACNKKRGEEHRGA
jgi:hypothetical protein